MSLNLRENVYVTRLLQNIGSCITATNAIVIMHMQYNGVYHAYIQYVM